MKFKFLLSSFIAFFTFGNLLAQSQRTCGTPLLPNDFEVWLQGVQAQLRQNNSSTTQIAYTLPVVIHIIHNGEAVGSGTNISNAQAMSQITVLNQDFSATNPDVGSVPSVWSALVANTQIQFCAAQVDPNGNIMSEPGIDRVNRNTKGFTAAPYTQTYIDNTIKPATIWDPNQYLNIWCLSLGNSLLGYATFPAPGTSGLAGLPAPYGTSTSDGVVILNTALGNIGATATPYDKGRTATHEIGHWLGLRHIWGDGTCATDYCNDTPPAGGSNFGCPTFPLSSGSCTGNSPNGEMFMNYMDYTDDLCMYMFTNDQKTRMQAIMAGSPLRMNLANSTKCNLPFALDAGIFSILNPANGSSSCSNSVTPQITLRNYGSSTLTSCTITYSMDGGANQVQNWTGSIVSGASTNINLNAFTGLTAGTHTLTVTASSPNGNTDQNSANNTATSIFTVIAGQSLPFTEGFEGTTFVPANWTYTPVNTTNKWARVTNASGFGNSTACAKMDNFTGNTNITGQIDIMTTPPISLSNSNNTLKLKFDVAYAKAGNNSNDSLNVFISTDCGATWTRIYTKGGTVLSTAPNTANAFTPTATQWRKDSVSLSNFVGQNTAYFRFVSVSGSDNNIYLDNININFTPSNIAPVAAITTSASTSCVGQAINLTDASTNGPTSWTWSTPGGNPSNAASQNTSVTYPNPGTYTITLTASNSAGSSTSTSIVTINALPNVSVSANNSTICSGNSATLTASGANSYLWSNGATGSSIVVNPTANTSYTVTGTDGNGCTNTAIQTVSVNALPTVTVSTNTNAICVGSSTTITAAGATTYSWSNGSTGASINVNPTTNTSYTVIGTAANGCTNSAVQSITVNALPNITVSTNNSTICSGLSTTITASGANTYSWSNGSTGASISVNPTTNTSYTVTGTGANGCTNSAVQSITVNTLPIVSINTSSTSICAGSTAILTASGASTYSWSNGANTTSISVNPTSTTSYSVTGNSSAGCTNSASIQLTVNIPTNSSVSILNDSICDSGNPETLLGTPTGGVYAGTGVNNGLFDPAQSGVGNFTISYIYTDSNSCTDTSFTNITVLACTGIKNNSLDNAFLIFPNPSNGTFLIQFSNANFYLRKIELLESSGKLVYNQIMESENTVKTVEVKLPEIENGLYFLRLSTDDTVTLKKLLIE